MVSEHRLKSEADKAAANEKAKWRKAKVQVWRVLD